MAGWMVEWTAGVDGGVDDRMDPVPSFNRHSIVTQPPSIHPVDLL
ncbi:hypothetical protein [Methanothrix sp.]|nr:hypothetical protein [Methanothrix sp.]